MVSKSSPIASEVFYPTEQNESQNDNMNVILLCVANQRQQQGVERELKDCDM